jgi:L-threonylcarbamoyladenylate synthase
MVPSLAKTDLWYRLFGVGDGHSVCPIVFNVHGRLKKSSGLTAAYAIAPPDLIAGADCRIMCAMHTTRDAETQVLAVDSQRPQSELIHRAACIIHSGGLVAFPTETVYGLGANALDAEAVTRIFAAKGRPTYDPVIVHVDSAAMLADLVMTITPVAARLTERFWPGALTLVLPKSDRVPMVVTAQGPTVAVRCPDHAVAQALIAAAECPIAAPSANRFSHTSPTTAQHVLDDLNGKIDLILDGGPTSIGVESTVLDLSGEQPVLLRPGGVPLEALIAELGAIDSPQDYLSDQDPASQALPSPGMLDRHYAPQATLHLYTGSDEAMRRSIAVDARRLAEEGHKVGLLLAKEDTVMVETARFPTQLIGSETDLTAIAHRLFNAMRALDAEGVDLILARDYASRDIGLAIQDRLRRAAQQVIPCT